MTDEITRRMIADAIAHDDLVRRDFECWQAKRERQQQQQREREQRQAAHEAEQRAVREWLMRTADEETSEGAEPADELDVDELTNEWPEPTGNKYDDDWNRWARGHVNFARREMLAWVNALARIIGEETGTIRREQEDNWRAEINKLKDEIAELRSLIGEDNTRSNIVPMLSLKGGRRDAA